MNNHVSLFPAWKNAVAMIASVRFKYGDLITHDEMDQLIEVEKPTGHVNAKRWQDYQVKRMSSIESVKTALLKDHNICLASDHGKGYLILHPKDQTKYAVAQSDKEIRKSLKSAKRRLININHQALDAAQRKENTDAIVRTASIAHGFRQAVRGLLPDLPRKIRKLAAS